MLTKHIRRVIMNTEFSKKYLRIFINIYKYKNHTVITRRLRTEEAVLNSKKITQKDINPLIENYVKRNEYDDIYVAVRLGDLSQSQDVLVHDWIGLRFNEV